MSKTHFFPEPDALGLPTPLRPTSDQGPADEALPAMEQDHARTQARQKAFGRVYLQYREKILKYIRRCLMAAAQAEDLLHDVMLAQWKNDLTGKCGDNEKCIESNLMIAAKRRVFDEFRAEGRQRRTVASLAGSVLTRVIQGDVTFWRAESRDIERHVNRLIWELPPRCRDAFIARRILEMSTEEAASYLGSSANTVKSHLRRANWLLRPKLAALGYSFIPEAQGEKKEATP